MTRLSLAMHRYIAQCVAAILAATPGFGFAEPWRGVDLSYVNELEDCGVEYRLGGVRRDPFELFADAGANIVRLRLWHTPDWTRYSTLDDVRKSIRRARAAGMRVLLDFHYSDDWAHPGKQLRPAAWQEAATADELAALLADYTREVLTELDSEGLLPDIVATGNEINTNMLVDTEVAEDYPIDWSRNVVIVNAALAAVHSIDYASGPAPQRMLHIAQPENVIPWFDAAIDAGLGEFEIIGISYYPKWSRIAFAELGGVLSTIGTRYGKDFVVVETAYPWTLDGNDDAVNLLGEDSLAPGYPASVDGQARFLADLQARVTDVGGLGVVYWEPAWVSSSCRTRWGNGSHWENAALFDFDGELLDSARHLADDDAESSGD